MTMAQIMRSRAQGRRNLRVASFVLMLVLLVALTMFAVRSQLGQTLDQVALDTVAATGARFQWVSAIMQRSVSPITIGVGTVLVMLVAVVVRRPALALRLGVLVVGANVTTQVLKTWVIARPFLHIGVDLPNSFPSGHMTVSLSLSLALVIACKQRIRSLVALIAALVNALVAIAIMGVGWHRPADIVGAVIVVALWALVLVPQEEATLQRDPTGTAMLTASGALMIVLLGLLTLANSLYWPVVNAVEGGQWVEEAVKAHHWPAVALSVELIAFALSSVVFLPAFITYLQSGRVNAPRNTGSKPRRTNAKSQRSSR
ncbi:phosphatase PAP2 family protein [Gleimia hominis]|uniref:Phosphatase PAP2 family protein n=1 Tax=Gleimia hominis TaxID=595468 RepID=A0ABU3I8T3_9ACTO|nr:phosphatase PAP2 family protein [Gleimia hominis]MDT3766623.1 phosphatase PAP2 family protein [Gleimia hominis]